MITSFRCINRYSLLATLSLTYLLLTVSSDAAEYQFTKVVDSSKIFSFSFPGINDLGVVAFRERTTDREYLIRRWDGGDISTLYSSQDIPALSGAERVKINNSSTVVFQGRIASGVTGIYAGDGGPLTTIADENGMFAVLDQGPRINDTGRVLFHSLLDDGGFGVFSGDGGPIATVAHTKDGFDNFRGREINDLDAFAYTAFSGDDRYVFYQEEGQPRTTLLEELDNPGFEFGGSIAINNLGQVLVSENYFTPGVGHDESILLRVGPDGETTIADSTGPFHTFFDVGINQLQDVAFQAMLDDGRRGIFSGPDATNDRIVFPGDALFGASVDEVFFDGALNDRGQVAFLYRLDNGIEGIALATPVPEPTTMALVFLCLAAVVAYARRSGS